MLSFNSIRIAPCIKYIVYFISQISMNKQAGSAQGRSGCYGVISQKQPLFELPLRSFHYNVQIVDCFAQVEMTQVYFNSLKKPLDVQYIFPVPSKGIVSKLKVKFGSNQLEGEIRQKLEAEQEFKKQVEGGTAAAYSEYNPQSRDIMRLKIGNIAQGEEITITFTYHHQNLIVNNSFYQYRLISTMTPRYVSSLDRAHVVFDQKQPEITVQGKCIWGIKITVRSTKLITKVESATHHIITSKDKDSIVVTFKNNDEIPNKDFSLYYYVKEYEKPSYLLSHNDNRTVAAITFIPKFFSDDALEQAKKNKKLQVDLDTVKGQYIFLLDRSGSMQGTRIENAKRSLQVFLRSLPQNSYFNVLSFGSTYNYLFKESAKNTKKQVDNAVNQIKAMEADLGGTEILQAIKELLKRPPIQGYPRQLFFLTDGAISNVSEVLKLISISTKYTRVHSIGIGNGCSQDLIRGCAQKGKGYCRFVQDNQKPEKKIIGLLEDTLSPVISKISLEYNESKVESIVPNPKKIPYILKNDLANFYFTFRGKLQEQFQIKISFTDSIGNKYSQTVIIDPKNYQCEFQWAGKISNYQTIKALCDTYEYQGSQDDRIYYVKQIDKQAIKGQIIKKSVQSQILTNYTAFLCVDTKTIDEQKQMKRFKDQKQRTTIKSMVPYDHVVTFCNELEEYGYDGEEEYQNQCCVINYENYALEPPKRQQFEDEIPQFSEVSKVKRFYKPLVMKARVAGKQGYLQIKASKQIKDEQKRQAYSYIIKLQESNGSWSEDFIDSLFPEVAEKMREQCQGDHQISFITFMVCQFLMRFYAKEPQFSLLIKKGKNYIDKNSKQKWNGFETIFHKYYEPLKDK